MSVGGALHRQAVPQVYPAVSPAVSPTPLPAEAQPEAEASLSSSTQASIPEPAQPDGVPASSYRSALGNLRYEYEADGVVSCRVTLGEEFTSHPGHIHGGLVATLFDEVMGHAAYCSAIRPMITLVLRVRFVEPMSPNVEHRLRAVVEPGSDGGVNVNGELFRCNGDDSVHAETLIAGASARFRPLGA